MEMPTMRFSTSRVFGFRGWFETERFFLLLSQLQSLASIKND